MVLLGLVNPTHQQVLLTVPRPFLKSTDTYESLGRHQTDLNPGDPPGRRALTGLWSRGEQAALWHRQVTMERLCAGGMELLAPSRTSLCEGVPDTVGGPRGALGHL